MGRPRKTVTVPEEPTVGYAVVTDDGQVVTIQEEDPNKFEGLATAIASTVEFNNYWFQPDRMTPNGTATRRLSPYQMYVQNFKPGLRDILVPSEHSFDEIIQRVNWYSNTNVWVNRALSLRAALDAAEFRIFAPTNQKQQEWLEKLSRELKMYSSVREMFWNLRAYDQACILWKTGRAIDSSPTRGLRPVSIECQDLQVVQPKGSGHVPKLVMYPHKDPYVAALAGLRKNSLQFKDATKVYPQVLIDAARRHEAVPVEVLEPYGYHFEYVSRNRRDWNDTAFPSMYSIFADLELIALAAEIDANALHHYKAGILQFAIGPENPTAIETIPGPNVLEATENNIKRQLQVRLATLFTRGDVHIRWVVPPVEILTGDKYKAALSRVMDYLGFPIVAWAGQSASGAYAAAVSAMKFLKAESEDDRALMKEMLENWLTERSETSNQFKKASPVRVRFDANALVEDRVILEMMRLFMSQGGASLSTVLDMADLDVEYEAFKRKELEELKKKYKVEFGPEFSNTRDANSGKPTDHPVGSTDRGGRPNEGETPSTEEQTGPQPRVSKATIEAIASRVGVTPDYIIDAMREAGEDVGGLA